MSVGGGNVPGAIPCIREKLRRGEPAARLADRELVALLVSTGRPNALDEADRLLESTGGLAGLAGSLERPAGARPRLGPAAAARLVAAVELSRRISRPEDLRPEISAPAHAAREARDLVSERREVMLGLFLDARCRLIARETIAVGSLNVARAAPRDVLEPAVRLLAAGFVLVHNHPSGSVEPSADDESFTRSLGRAAQLLGVELHDHVIVGRGGYVSLRARGVLASGGAGA